MILQFSILKPFSDRLIHGVTTKHSGQPKEELIFNHQVHSKKVLNIEERPNSESDADGLITKVPNLPIAARVADCQGILMFDPTANIIAAIHSGWRGSTLNIIGEAIEKMMK